jgi:holo-[acyl-carrier protein] synthase
LVLGIGLDLIDLERFAALYGRADPDVLARCFTSGELSACGEGVDRLARLAARFAAKEAAYKALGGISGASLTDVEIVSDRQGAPALLLHRRAALAAANLGAAKLFVSLTHTSRSAAAMVVAV